MHKISFPSELVMIEKPEGTVFEGDLLVADDTELFGVVTGSVIVEGSVYLGLYGSVRHDLVLTPDSFVEMHGYIYGDVYNRGGKLAVFGTVMGKVHRLGGSTTVDPNAIIRGGLV